jgi:hypothetical protein
MYSTFQQKFRIDLNNDRFGLGRSAIQLCLIGYSANIHIEWQAPDSQRASRKCRTVPG